MSFLANFLTISALACGFASIIFSFEGKLMFSAWAVIMAAVFDGLDGQVSRIGPGINELGRQLDSLADAISFGVAPAVLGYIFASRGIYLWPASVLFVYLVCGIFRLARYNIAPRQKITDYFSGLPITAAGGLVAAYILLYRDCSAFSSPRLFLSFVLLLCFLMVSRVRYMSLGAVMRLAAGKNLVFSIVLVSAGAIFNLRLSIFLFLSAYLFLAPFLLKKTALENQ